MGQAAALSQSKDRTNRGEMGNVLGFDFNLHVPGPCCIELPALAILLKWVCLPAEVSDCEQNFSLQQLMSVQKLGPETVPFHHCGPYSEELLSLSLLSDAALLGK